MRKNKNLLLVSAQPGGLKAEQNERHYRKNTRKIKRKSPKDVSEAAKNKNVGKISWIKILTASLNTKNE